jgi:hypothetical protein
MKSFSSSRKRFSVVQVPQARQGERREPQRAGGVCTTAMLVPSASCPSPLPANLCSFFRWEESFELGAHFEKAVGEGRRWSLRCSFPSRSWRRYISSRWHEPVRDSTKRSITGYRLNHTPMGQRQPQRNRRRRCESPHAFPLRKGIRPPRISEP